MVAKILAKIFGSKNDRELKRIKPIVAYINSLEPRFAQMSDVDLSGMTNVFRERLSNGASLDTILPEAFAVVREVGKRTLNMRHFDTQLIGGIVLHEGKISEMKTGEGKTLVATLPLYLNALTGKGAHLVTVNDYLAKRDAEWMMPIYNFLGLSVGIMQNTMENEERQQAYSADITYGTNSEFGFDYLRDNMKFNLEDYVQRDLNFAIVDEVDSILIDEARTPLIISGATERHSKFYEIADRAVKNLVSEDFELDEKERSVTLTESGVDRIEHMLGLANLYAPENILALHHVSQALRARTMFKIDVDYVVRDGEVLIVDEFTGRILPGRRYSDGLHQALEAKEGVRIESENQTLASITLQNYFRLYKKLAGMTGTAMTEAGEFHKIYKLAVIEIPTNRPMIRDDQGDVVFLTKDDKFKAVVDDIKECHAKGQPVLVGTIAIETSEYLSYLLHQAGIKHNVLNAKQHAREAEIVKEAGEKGRVTIATNMAGRGTDIKISDEIRALGGLRIIGTERHENRRIDNQLRGRAGRQGDPGSSKFYISLEDDLMRIFGGDKTKKMMERVGMKPGESIEHPFLTHRIEKAQEKVEKREFDIRKQLLEYDDVLNQQRSVIYEYRREILEGASQSRELVKTMIADTVYGLFNIYCPQGSRSSEDLAMLHDALSKVTGLSREYVEQSIDAQKGITQSNGSLEQNIVEFLAYEYGLYRAAINPEIVDEAEKWVLLETVDQAWKMHMQNMDHLKEGIGLRGYGQKNPLIEYKKESFVAFEEMIGRITHDIVTRIFKLKPDTVSHAALHEIEKQKARELADLQIGGSQGSSSQHVYQQNSDAPLHHPQPVRREAPKVGRNDLCPCGSEKKYKHCCGV